MNLAFPQKEKLLFVAGSLLFFMMMAIGYLMQQQLLIAVPFSVLAMLFFVKDIRMPFYLLMFTIPFSFNLEERLHIGIDFPDEPFMLILTAAFLFFVFLNFRKIDFKTWFKNPVMIVVILSFIWMAITVVFSTDPVLSSKYLVKRIWYLTPFLFFPILFFADRKNIKTAFTLMFVPLTAIILIILYKYSAVGFRFEEVHDPIQPFFLNHVMYGSMISSFVPLIAGAIFLCRRWSLAWLFSLAGLAVFLTGVYFSYSRAAWLAVVFAVFAMLAIRFRLMHYAMMLFYTIVLSAVLWMSHNNQYLNYRPKFEKTIMHTSLADHIMATIQGTDISSAERYYRWIAAVRMSVDRPITGVGPNNFYENYKHYTISAYRTWVSRNLERSTTHNYFLFMLVEQGYPALILYALLILVIFYYGQKVYHRQHDRFNKVVVMSVLCMVAAIFINNFFSELLETDKIGSLFLLAIATLIAIDLKTKRKPEEEALV